MLVQPKFLSAETYDVLQPSAQSHTVLARTEGRKTGHLFRDLRYSTASPTSTMGTKATHPENPRSPDEAASS